MKSIVERCKLNMRSCKTSRVPLLSEKWRRAKNNRKDKLRCHSIPFLYMTSPCLLSVWALPVRNWYTLRNQWKFLTLQWPSTIPSRLLYDDVVTNFPVVPLLIIKAPSRLHHMLQKSAHSPFIAAEHLHGAKLRETPPDLDGTRSRWLRVSAVKLQQTRYPQPLSGQTVTASVALWRSSAYRKRMSIITSVTHSGTHLDDKGDSISWSQRNAPCTLHVDNE